MLHDATPPVVDWVTVTLADWKNNRSVYFPIKTMLDRGIHIFITTTVAQSHYLLINVTSSSVILRHTVVSDYSSDLSECLGGAPPTDQWFVSQMLRDNNTNRSIVILPWLQVTLFKGAVTNQTKNIPFCII